MSLTIDESRRLEQWCLAHTDDIGAVLAIGYLYLGPRNTELCRRDVRDLDDSGTLLRIGKTKTAAGRRGLRIPEPYASILLERAAGRAGDEPLFPNIHGRRMSSESARSHVMRVCEAAGVTVVPPQALRRTHATLSAEVGETGYAIARALGHATGGAPKVTGESYIKRGAARAAQGAAVLRVIRGGRS